MFVETSGDSPSSQGGAGQVAAGETQDVSMAPPFVPGVERAVPDDEPPLSSRGDAAAMGRASHPQTSSSSSDAQEETGAPGSLRDPTTRAGEERDDDDDDVNGAEHHSVPRVTTTSTVPRALSAREHELFVEGVERSCAADADEAAVWRAIGAHARRCPEDVKAHAMYYLMSLQSRTPDRDVAWGPDNEAPWSDAEDALFEQGLATYDEGDADRWHKIAALLPGKSPRDVRLWYERLVGDLLDIERGAVCA